MSNSRYFAMIIFFAVFALNQNTNAAESNYTVERAIPTFESNSGLSAALFFTPIREGLVRDPSWPEYLTLEPLTLTLEELKKKLIGEWALVYHCNGRPMDAKSLAMEGYWDGYYNHSARLWYDKDNRAHRLLLLPLAKKGDLSISSWYGKKPDVLNEYTVEQDLQGWFKISYKGIGDRFQFHPDIIRPMKVKETNEILINYKKVYHFRDLECAPGVQVQMILVPLPVSS